MADFQPFLEESVVVRVIRQALHAGRAAIRQTGWDTGRRWAAQAREALSASPARSMALAVITAVLVNTTLGMALHRGFTAWSLAKRGLLLVAALLMVSDARSWEAIRGESWLCWFQHRARP